MTSRRQILTFFLLGSVLAASPATLVLASEPDVVDGAVAVSAFSLPPSGLASPESRRIRSEAQAKARRDAEAWSSIDLNTRDGILQARRLADDARRAMAEDMLTRYPVSVTPQIIGGVQTDIVAPKAGVSDRNRSRVLINLHGGGFVFGARYEGQVASIPLAGLGQIKVITVDYRMGPEHRFPAASEDVATVYRELLKSYRPENIGIYGCSAGAILTAEAVAWFQAHGLPRPGAIALDSAGAIAAVKGDSHHWWAAMSGAAPNQTPDRGSIWLQHYFPESGVRDPLQSPAFDPETLKSFPPSLLISATRDYVLSSVLFTHRQLLKAGAQSELHVFEGMEHCFTYDDRLPESRDAFAALLRFFDKHLRTEPR